MTLQQHRPLRKEFYTFWNSGLDTDNITEESAAVCSLIMDKGETNVTRIFCSEADVEENADELLIEWLTEHPLILEADDIEMKIYFNYSPQAATSQAIINLVSSLQEQQKQIKVAVKFAQLYKTDNNEDAEENREGLRKLKMEGFRPDVFHEADWFYLSEILADKRSRKLQTMNANKAKQKLREIFTDPKDAGSATECVVTSETETMTECDAVSSSDSDS